MLYNLFFSGVKTLYIVVVKREEGQKMTNFSTVNIFMRKMTLEVEFLKSMIYEILKIFRRITFHPEMILRHLF